MSRRVVSALPQVEADSGSSTYQVWLTDEQNRLVTKALAMSKLGWADWVKQAIERLMRESEDELRGIVGGVKRSTRTGKEQVSFRCYKSSINQAKDLASRFDSNVQTVFATAFYMQALAPVGIKLPEPAGAVSYQDVS